LTEEFEEIILHYLDMGKASLAKKALKLALSNTQSHRIKISAS
jgi:hypothetical protein